MPAAPTPTAAPRQTNPAGSARHPSSQLALAVRPRAAHRTPSIVHEIPQPRATLRVAALTTVRRSKPARKPTSRLSGDRVARLAVATLATVIALIVPAPVGADQQGSVTVSFDAVTTTGDWQGGQALGTFTMTGALADVGTVRIAYWLFGRRIRATATLMGGKGILTIGLGGTLAPILDGRQSIVGRWRTCGGTGPYRHPRGRGDWTAVVDVLAAPAGMVPRALHGAYVGRIYRGSAHRRAGSFSAREAHC
jgi:hypothetical protein